MERRGKLRRQAEGISRGKEIKELEFSRFEKRKEYKQIRKKQGRGKATEVKEQSQTGRRGEKSFSRRNLRETRKGKDCVFLS